MDRWPEIEALYHRAQAWPRDERAARLAEACSGDRDLRREVEELLAQDDRSGQLLDRPAWNPAASAVREESGVRAGMTLGAYEIESPLGAGGMGEVWKARDRRLNRAVAIKISRAQFSDRVEREARAVAALNHPNIGALYDVGVAPSGVTYLVLEYVDGLTLADRLARGPISLADALPITRQIADALEAAHERGVIHRDLKPANIKLRLDGTIKVLDFGLAKALDVSGDAMVSEITAVGTITGTAAYMAPEQARGEVVDKRADIWAFGVVVYEMLTGQRPFTGDSVPDVLASVLRQEPDFTLVAPKIRRLLRSCLEKDPRKRLRDIGDAMRLLMDDAATGEPPVTSPRHLWRAAAAAVLVLLAGIPLFFYARPQRLAGAPPSVSFQIIPPGISAYNALALSPDSRSLAFSARGFDGVSRLWIRDFTGMAARSIPEADGIAGAPIWSPDSRTLAFASGGRLKRIAVSGGAPSDLCDWGGDNGELTGTWGSNDEILFSRPAGGLQRVPASGGACVDVTSTGRGPVLLPDGRHFIYLLNDTDVKPLGTQAGLYLGSLEVPPAMQHPQLMVRNPGYHSLAAAFFQTPDRSRSYLVFNQYSGSSAVFGTLVAQPFDLKALQLTGAPAPLSVAMSGGFGNGSSAALFSFSPTGAIAYSTNGTGRYQDVWYDRSGTVTGTAGDAGDFGDVALSPDGKQVAYHNREGTDDLWLFDIARRTAARLTSDSDREHQAVWSPDSRLIMWAHQHEQHQSLVVKNANGTGDEHLVVNDDGGEFNIPEDWSPDGRTLLYANGALPSGPQYPVGAGLTIWTLLLQTSGLPAGPPSAYVQSPQGVGHAKFSPNGRFVAYTIGTGEGENVYVSPFPSDSGHDERWTVSSGGGYQPLWRGDGKELLYLSADGKVMSVDVKTDSTTFASGTPKPLFSIRIAGGPASAPTHRWDVTRDGQHFVVVTVLDVTQSPPINVVTDWESQLKR